MTIDVAETQAVRDRFRADAVVSRHPDYIETYACFHGVVAAFTRLAASGVMTAEQAEMEIEAMASVLRQVWTLHGGEIIDGTR